MINWYIPARPVRSMHVLISRWRINTLHCHWFVIIDCFDKLLSWTNGGIEHCKQWKPKAWRAQSLIFHLAITDSWYNAYDTIILIWLVLELSVIVTFIHSLDFYIASFPLNYFILLIYLMSWYVWIYSLSALSPLKTSLVHIRVMLINKTPYHTIPYHAGFIRAESKFILQTTLNIINLLWLKVDEWYYTILLLS